jgi:ABC-2 type transport system permease protein
MVIYFFGVLTIPDKVRTGDLDLYLTKPVNPLLRITFEQANPGSIPLILMSICIILFGVKAGGFHITAFQLIGYVFFVLLMTILWYDMEVLIRILSFFVISTTNITKIEEIGLDLCMKIPGVVMKGIYKVLFYVILPYGIISTIPTQTLTGTITPKGTVFGVFIVCMFTVFTLSLWKLGLKHYNSASS